MYISYPTPKSAPPLVNSVPIPTSLSAYIVSPAPGLIHCAAGNPVNPDPSPVNDWATTAPDSLTVNPVVPIPVSYTHLTLPTKRIV